MKREFLVGTAFKDHEDKEFVLVEFLGEGNTGVVYVIAPIEDLSKRETVIKLFKPKALLEMNILHHSFRVYEQKYPQHPLLMSKEERLQRLTEEMLEKIGSERLTFRVEIYRELLETTITVLANQFIERYESGDLTSGFLSEIGVIERTVDENLLYRIDELLEEDAITPKFQSFFEYLIDEIRQSITNWQATRTYHPFSKNPIYNLLGLYMEDFINREELLHISQVASFTEQVTMSHLNDLFLLITAMVYRALDKRDELGEEPPDTKDFEDGLPSSNRLNYEMAQFSFRSRISAISLACELLENFARQDRWRNRHLVGLSKYWLARTLWLEDGDPAQIVNLMESALSELTELESLGDRHDILLDLIRFYASVDDQKALDYVEEAQVIEEKLGVPIEQRTRLSAEQ